MENISNAQNVKENLALDLVLKNTFKPIPNLLVKIVERNLILMISNNIKKMDVEGRNYTLKFLNNFYF